MCDRTHRRVQVFKPDGTYVTQVFISRTSDPSAAVLAFSPDAGQLFLYVADYGNSTVRKIAASGGNISRISVMSCVK